MTKPTFKVTVKIMYIVNAKKDELRNYQIPLHSSIYNFEKL